MATRSEVLLVAKRAGTTSFASLYPIKRNIDRKVGHAGTLDKFAEGLMVVLTGSFTRLNPLFSELDKRYVATIEFGRQTDTLDPEGEVVAVAPVPGLQTISDVLRERFTGTIDQAPPLYSALHVDGVRAHTLARRGVQHEMPTRPVTIHGTAILSWQEPLLRLEVHCSKGTYIRSLARDLAAACGSCGHLRNLKRTAIGPFRLDEAVDADDLIAVDAMALDSKKLLSRLDRATCATLSEASVITLRYGRLPNRTDLRYDGDLEGKSHAVMLDPHDRIVAVVALGPGGNPVHLVALVQDEVPPC